MYYANFLVLFLILTCLLVSKHQYEIVREILQGEGKIPLRQTAYKPPAFIVEPSVLLKPKQKSTPTKRTLSSTETNEAVAEKRNAFSITYLPPKIRLITGFDIVLFAGLLAVKLTRARSWLLPNRFESYIKKQLALKTLHL